MSFLIHFFVQIVRALVNPASIEDDEGQDPEVHQDEAHSPDVRQDDVGEPLARAVQREEHFLGVIMIPMYA